MGTLCSQRERREILTHAAARMNREDTVPRGEKPDAAGQLPAQSHFHEVPTLVRFAETEDNGGCSRANAGEGWRIHV